MPQAESPGDLLTAPEVAARLHVTDETVRAWAKSGKLTHIVLPSGGRRFRRSDVDAILEPVATPAADE